MVKVFIIILNWNRYKDTLECLRSVEKLQISNYILQVVVVDNASANDCVEKIKNLKLKILNDKSKLKIIENKENLGFAAGNNIGIRFALENGADYILILNNDTLVEKQLLLHLIEQMENNQKIGAISPKIYFAKGFEFHKDRYKPLDLGRVIWYAGGIIDWQNVYGKTFGVDQVDYGQYNKTKKTDFVTGTCLLLRKQALKETGLFDDKYFMYYEDTDLSIRLKNKDWLVFFEPKGEVWHKVAQSSSIGGDLNDYFITRNRLLFGLRHAPWRAKLALLKESLFLLNSGRKWQKTAVRDFYLGRFGKGSWKENKT